ncbi:hypothetical protein LCGC14_2629710 [marine sediment metagenome]|uniref:Uncharacterized protein n=1 Tax=marine sediment metagenome TaxID=412755 RepID=A0A0F9CBK9_9ZZZZ
MPSQSPAAPPPPTLHKPVPMGARVLVPELYMGLKDGKPYEGEVVGVAFFMSFTLTSCSSMRRLNPHTVSSKL